MSHSYIPCMWRFSYFLDIIILKLISSLFWNPFLQDETMLNNLHIHYNIEFSTGRNIGQSCDMQNQTSTHDMEDHIILPTKEIQSNTVRRIRQLCSGTTNVCFLWISLTMVILLLLRVTLVPLRYGRVLVSNSLGCCTKVASFYTKTPGRLLSTDLWMVAALQMGSYGPSSLQSQSYAQWFSFLWTP